MRDLDDSNDRQFLKYLQESRAYQCDAADDEWYFYILLLSF